MPRSRRDGLIFGERKHTGRSEVREEEAFSKRNGLQKKKDRPGSGLTREG